MSTRQRQPEESFESLVTRAETILTQMWGGKVRLAGDAAGSGLEDRSHVHRLRVLEGPGDAPKQVIVKLARNQQKVASEPGADPYRHSWLFNDWAGLQFLSEVADDLALAPRFYAGDREAGLMVIEDLGTGPGLHDLLQGSDPQAAEEGAVKLARTLGAMHAVTIGKDETFARIREALGPTRSIDRQWIMTALPGAAHMLNITPAPGIGEELSGLVEMMERPGPFQGYTHGDPCPDNMVIGETARLFDFEVGAFRHVLLDGVYGRIHFPTCWCVNRLPERVMLRMEREYREELVKGCPEAKDDMLFYRAMVAACACWVIDWCREEEFQRILEQDRPWGISTHRQRLLFRCDIVARITQEFRYLEAIGATLGKLAAVLRAMWPSEADTMPYYPAFR